MRVACRQSGFFLALWRVVAASLRLQWAFPHDT